MTSVPSTARRARNSHRVAAACARSAHRPVCAWPWPATRRKKRTVAGFSMPWWRRVVDCRPAASLGVRHFGEPNQSTPGVSQPGGQMGESGKSCHLSWVGGGSGEIRTHGRLTPSAVFKTAAINRSATLPVFDDLHRSHLHRIARCSPAFCQNGARP